MNGFECCVSGQKASFAQIAQIFHKAQSNPLIEFFPQNQKTNKQPMLYSLGGYGNCPRFSPYFRSSTQITFILSFQLQSAQSNEEELRIKMQNLEAQLTETMRQLEEQKQRIGKGRMAGDLVEVRKANEIMKERDKLRNELAEMQRKLQAATQKVVQLQERLDGADEERTVAIRRAELAERVCNAAIGHNNIFSLSSA